MEADQTNATVDAATGAVYSYIPAETDGDAFMFEIQKGEFESETLKFQVRLNFLFTLVYQRGTYVKWM